MEDVENALVALTQDHIREGRLAEAARSYGEAATLSRTLWQAGTSGFLDVLDAERSRYSAEDALIQSRVAIATDAIALSKALGGAWDDPVVIDRPLIIDVGTGPHLFEVVAPTSPLRIVNSQR
jgi:outer membrane protein TolC